MTPLASDDTLLKEIGPGSERREPGKSTSLRSRKISSIKKGKINWVLYYIKINCVAFKDKINLSFFQTTDKPTHGLQQQQQKKSQLDYQEGFVAFDTLDLAWIKESNFLLVFWSHYNFGIISYSFYGYLYI